MPTHAEVVAKFKELHTKYHYTRGYLISTVPDELLSRFSGKSWSTGTNLSPTSGSADTVTGTTAIAPLRISR
jgi:hypothetical protein